MTATAVDWIARLDLVPHPEGGWFRESYRATEAIDAVALPARFGGARPLATAIYFLLEAPQVSRLHRLRSDELWHFYAGDPLVIIAITPDGRRLDRLLGPEAPQVVVPAGEWFGARLAAGIGWALVGCTVAPGFALADLELADRAELVETYPPHRAIIEALTP